MPRLIVVVLVAGLFLGCGKKPPEDKVINVADNDPAMNAAIQKAKDTVLQQFVPALQAPKAGQVGFAIKYPVGDGKTFEHFWISRVTFDGKKFTGKLDNIPKLVKTVKLGQTMNIAPDEISDWMYLDNGRLVGGFSIRVLRDSLKGKEREDFDKETPFKFD